MSYKRIITIIVFTLSLLQGCSAVSSFNTMLENKRLAQEQARLELARTSCVNYGFAAGTDAFSQCVQTEVNNIKDREAVAAAAKETSDAIEDSSNEPRTTSCRTDLIGNTTCKTQ